MFVLLSALGVKAQQAPIFTNYTNSYAYVNPGFAGLSEGVNLLGLYRQQWSGFTDDDGNDVAPVTFLLTGDVPIPLMHGGISAAIVQDKLGFENNTNVCLGYSFHMDLGGSTLGIGVAGSLLSRTVDFSQYNPTNGSDPALQGLSEESQMLFDFNAGLFWQIPESFYVGVSAINVLETMGKSLAEGSTSSASFTTDRTFYAVAGYQFQFETLPAYVFIPSIGIMSDIASSQLNVGAKVMYNNAFSLGVNYRPQESVDFLVGLKIKDVNIGYSYDINTMGLGVPGSHELSVSYCFKLDLNKSPNDYRSVRYL